MTFQTTSIYAAILGLMMIVFIVRVIQTRVAEGVSILDGGNEKVAITMRQHGNFIEMVPMALILMAMVEASGASSTWLHAIGILTLVGRIIHPFGLRADKSDIPARIIGNSATMLAIVLAAGLILWKTATQM